MAQGDITFFNEFLEDEGTEIHQLSTDELKCALTDGTTTPTASTADPRWGAGGTTNFSAEEVTPGGNYTTGGTDVVNTFSESAGTATLGATDISWAQNASNPTNARWGIIYNNTSTGKEAVAFVDLGSSFNMTTGDLSISWGSSAIGTKTAS